MWLSVFYFETVSRFYTRDQNKNIGGEKLDSLIKKRLKGDYDRLVRQ